MRLIWEVHYLLAKDTPTVLDLDPFKLRFGNDEKREEEKDTKDSTELPSEEEQPHVEPVTEDNNSSNSDLEYETAKAKLRWGALLKGFKTYKRESPNKGQ